MEFLVLAVGSRPNYITIPVEIGDTGVVEDWPPETFRRVFGFLPDGGEEELYKYDGW